MNPTTHPTRRPTVPAAEEILGGYFPVLDHGFVALVDYMGTDDSVERAARVSYGYGTRKVSATRGLIRYLRRHLHTTPSEMVEFKFHCAMPMFCLARQWIRHRTALRPDKQRSSFFRRDRVRRMRLRQVDEDTLVLQHTHIVDVYRNGAKPVFWSWKTASPSRLRQIIGSFSPGVGTRSEERPGCGRLAAVRSGGTATISCMSTVRPRGDRLNGLGARLPPGTRPTEPSS